MKDPHLRAGNHDQLREELRASSLSFHPNIHRRCVSFCSARPERLTRFRPRAAPYRQQTKLLGITTRGNRTEEHTSELQSLMRKSYDVFCLKDKNKKHHKT